MLFLNQSIIEYIGVLDFSFTYYSFNELQYADINKTTWYKYIHK